MIIFCLYSPAKRAANSAALVADAKDKVVETIIAELAEIKNSMVGAVTDLAAAQKVINCAIQHFPSSLHCTSEMFFLNVMYTSRKTLNARAMSLRGPITCLLAFLGDEVCSALLQAADAAQAAAAVTKKPLSPYAAMWAKPSAATTAKPPLPVEPVRQKVVLLGQVFDMLTDMEKDITSSMVRTGAIHHKGIYSAILFARENFNSTNGEVEDSNMVTDRGSIYFVVEVIQT